MVTRKTKPTKGDLLTLSRLEFSSWPEKSSGVKQSKRVEFVVS